MRGGISRESVGGKRRMMERMISSGSRWVGALVLLFAASAAAQDIYTWTDDEGVEQFTDNPSAIPEKFRKKARITTGGELNVISHDGDADPPPARATAQKAAARPQPVADGPNKCVVMKKKIGDLEFSISQQKTEYEARVTRCQNNAARVTRTGQVVPVRGCSETNGPTQLKARLEADTRKLESMKDELRVMQHQGC